MNGQVKMQEQSECVQNVTAPIGTEKRRFIIYKVTNRINGKVYIGQTVKSLDVRKKEHIRKARSVKSWFLHNAIRKYGKDAFYFEIIRYCVSKEELNEKEMELIKEFKTKAPLGYNMTDGGEGTMGYYPSQETRAKMGKAHKGNKYSLGCKHSEERKAEERKRMIGNTYMVGRKLSDETRARVSKSLMGNKRMVGYKHSEETKEKVSKFQKGRPKSEETRAKMSAAAKGRKVTDETKAKLAKSWIARKQKVNSPIASNTSGVPGVSWHKAASKWRAEITINNKYKYLGLFNNKQDAGDAYLRAKHESRCL